MRLGTQTGSMVNHLMSGTNGQPDPTVGMGATELCWTDRRAYTIVAVLSPTRIVVQRDDVKRTDNNGMSEAQAYEYTPNPNAGTETLRKAKNGGWYSQGGMKHGRRFRMGDRSEYYDYSF